MGPVKRIAHDDRRSWLFLELMLSVAVIRIAVASTGMPITTRYMTKLSEGHGLSIRRDSPTNITSSF